MSVCPEFIFLTLMDVWNKKWKSPTRPYTHKTPLHIHLLIDSGLFFPPKAHE